MDAIDLPITQRAWSALKRWRRLHFGPLSLIFKFERRVYIKRGSARRRNAGRRENDSRLPETRSHAGSEAPGCAMIVGVGPGFGYALAHRLAQERYNVILVSRNVERLDFLIDQIRSKGGEVYAFGCDATLESSVDQLFADVKKEHGVPDLVVYSIQNFGPGNTVDAELAAFEDGWRHNCLGSFIIAKKTAREMVPRHSGSIVLVGSTSAVIGREGHLNLAVGKFAQRALAQVMARELWSQGIHVAHLIIDADIAEHELSDHEPQADPLHIAESVLYLHRQPSSAWTSEMDLRPWNEKFWEHC